MRQYEFLQLDVFTDSAFGGNPLAVFPEAEGLTDEEMQRIAREMNLSETVFVLPSSDERALRRLRIFTPTLELPMAGHPVVGTWNALALEGVVPMPSGGDGWTRIHQEIAIGVLPVDVEFRENRPARVLMTQGEFKILADVEDASERAEIERGLGLAPEEIDESLPIQTISTGFPILVVPVRSLDSLARCRINMNVLADAYHRAGASLCYAFTRETLDGSPSQAHARSFVPDAGIPEDPATGGAAGPLGAYLFKHGALDIEATDGLFQFTIEQGDFMHRPSRIQIEIETEAEAASVKQVRVGGPSVVVARGQLMF